MKSFKTLSIAFAAASLLVISFSCSSTEKTVYKTPYETNPYSTSEFISKDTQGLLQLRGVGDEAKTTNDAILSAQKRALEKLFFLGFPGTDFKQPMIANTTQSTAEQQHSAFFTSFWNGGFQQFITSQTPKTYKCKNTTNCYTATSTFTINYNALRKELERNNVIRKMGF